MARFESNPASLGFILLPLTSISPSSIIIYSPSSLISLFDLSPLPLQLSSTKTLRQKKIGLCLRDEDDTSSFLSSSSIEDGWRDKGEGRTIDCPKRRNWRKRKRNKPYRGIYHFLNFGLREFKIFKYREKNVIKL